MNESETRAEYIDPKLKASGWGSVKSACEQVAYSYVDTKQNLWV